MNTMTRMALATVVLGSGLSMLPTAEAATVTSFYYINSAQACQLSTPTIDTVVAPRATGFRNPGTSGAFVICGFSKMNNLQLDNALALLVSMDGQAHDISCTGVNGLAGISTQSYVAKTIAVPATGYTAAGYSPADFGGSSTIPGSQFNFSITCNLPPQVAITLLFAQFSYEVGS